MRGLRDYHIRGRLVPTELRLLDAFLDLHGIEREPHRWARKGCARCGGGGRVYGTDGHGITSDLCGCLRSNRLIREVLLGE